MMGGRGGMILIYAKFPKYFYHLQLINFFVLMYNVMSTKECCRERKEFLFIYKNIRINNIIHTKTETTKIKNNFKKSTFHVVDK